MGKRRGSAVLGVVGLLLGIAGLVVAGLSLGGMSIPGACVAQAPLGGGGCATGVPVEPSISFTVSGLAVTVQNTAPTVEGQYAATTVGYTWGDGSATTTVSASASTTHSYADPGTYSVHASETWRYLDGATITVTTAATASVTVGASGQTDFPVTFSAGSSLTAGTTWGVTFNGNTQQSATSTVVFTPGVPDGTYAYTVMVPSSGGWLVTPSSGSITVSGGPYTQTLGFYVPTVQYYTATIVEGGLPSGTSWAASIGSITLYSTGNTILFMGLADGTYAYSVFSTANFTASPASGTIVINGANSGATATFTGTATNYYLVTFSESGLPTGTEWTVTLGGLAKSSVGESVIFNEPAGSYGYTIAVANGQTPNPASGSVTVTNAAQAVGVNYGSAGGGGTPWFVWLLGGSSVLTLLGGIAAFGRVGVGALLIIVGIAIPTLLYLVGLAAI